MRLVASVVVALAVLQGHAGEVHAEGPTPAPALTAAPDLVVQAATGSLRLTPFAADVDWALSSPDGRHALAGTELFTRREKDGTAGRFALYPSGKPIGLAEVGGRGHRFSPDGRYVLVASDRRPVRDGRGWRAVPPTSTVLDTQDGRVVERFVGTDAQWVSSSTLAFRRGAQAFRIEVGSGAKETPIGVPVPDLACLEEGFAGGETRCASRVWSHVLGIDASLGAWVVEDESNEKGIDRIRVVDLATGRSRRIAGKADGTPPTTEGIVASVSPRGARVCTEHFVWDPKPGPPVATQTRLVCAVLPGGAPEVVLATADRQGIAWVDDDRVLVQADGDVRVLDLRARTSTRIVGLPLAHRSLIPLPGGRRVLVSGGTDKALPAAVLDLQARTWTPFGGPGEDLRVEYTPGGDRRMVVRHGGQAPVRASWVEIGP